MTTTADRTIEKTLELDAPVERVWRAITDASELSLWFGHQAELEPVPGAEGTFTWEQHGSFAVKVEIVEPPRRFVWSWVHEEGVAFGAAPSTRVEWLLTEREDGGTTLRLRESGFRTDLHHRQNDQGWDEELGELVALFAEE